MSIGKVTGVRTIHPVPCRGLRPTQRGFDLEHVDAMDVVSAGVLYDFGGKRRLIPWANITHVELEIPASKKGSKD